MVKVLGVEWSYVVLCLLLIRLLGLPVRSVAEVLWAGNVVGTLLCEQMESDSLVIFSCWTVESSLELD